MSIDIEVGIFVDRADDEESAGFFAYYDREFEAINAFLRSIGLPEHHEPIALTDQPAFHRSAKSEMYPLRDIAWDIERQTSLRFPHLLTLSGEDAIYLPILFEEVLGPLPARCLGSSYKLYEECRLLAKLLDIYDEIEDNTNIFKTAQFSRDPIVLVLERMLGLDKKDRDVPFLTMRNQMLSWYPILAENPWNVAGTGACMNLYEAAKCSIKHKAALVIH